MDIMIGIYKITNKITGKCYIGESQNVEKRWNEHKQSLKEGCHHSYKLQQDYKKYGAENFTYEILEEIDKDFSSFTRRLILIVLEDKYIKQYNSIDQGYNVENTLWKILNREQNVFTDRPPKEYHRKILISVIKNMKENNGKFIRNKNKSSNKLEKPIKTKQKKDKIDKQTEYISTNKNIVLQDKLSFKDCMNYFSNNNYKFNCKYNDIFKELRKQNIFYYDENNSNLPNDNYISKYFEIENIYIEDKTIPYKKIWVLREGVEFLKDILINLNIISYIGG